LAEKITKASSSRPTTTTKPTLASSRLAAQKRSFEIEIPECEDSINVKRTRFTGQFGSTGTSAAATPASFDFSNDGCRDTPATGFSSDKDSVKDHQEEGCEGEQPKPRMSLRERGRLRRLAESRSSTKKSSSWSSDNEGDEYQPGSGDEEPYIRVEEGHDEEPAYIPPTKKGKAKAYNVDYDEEELDFAEPESEPEPVRRKGKGKARAITPVYGDELALTTSESDSSEPYDAKGKGKANSIASYYDDDDELSEVPEPEPKPVRRKGKGKARAITPVYDDDELNSSDYNDDKLSIYESDFSEPFEPKGRSAGPRKVQEKVKDAKSAARDAFKARVENTSDYYYTSDSSCGEYEPEPRKVKNIPFLYESDSDWRRGQKYTKTQRQGFRRKSHAITGRESNYDPQKDKEVQWNPSSDNPLVWRRNKWSKVSIWFAQPLVDN
jgi:hypothetical protein